MGNKDWWDQWQKEMEQFARFPSPIQPIQIGAGWGAVGIGNQEAPVAGNVINFQGGTQYWSQTQPHAVMSSYVRGVARKKWDLIDPVASTLKGKPDFAVPKTPDCITFNKNMGRYRNGLTCYWAGYHPVPEEDVYVYVTDILGMTTRAPQIVEKEVVVIQEKIVEVFPGLTLEKRSILQDALTREIHAAQRGLKDAIDWNEGDKALAIRARLETIRELMGDFAMEPSPPGEPGWLMVKKESEDQMEMFDG